MMRNGARPGLLEILDVDARRDLTARSRTVRVRKGQSVLARSEAAGEVFIVQEGRLHVVLYAADGREVSLRELGEGQMFGELSAIDGESRSVSIVAATDARLLALAPDLFRRTVLTHPDAADWLIRRLTAQVRGLTDRVFELSALNVRARLHCELLRLARSRAAGSEAAPTHAELASRIGTHREAITRELALLAERNIIKSGRKRLEFLDVAQLEEAVAATLRAPAGDAGWW
jgi:CRP/FNR family cyclic AMP-dependent transcriptional regulator